MKKAILRKYICICICLSMLILDKMNVYANDILENMDTTDEIAASVKDYVEPYIGVSTVGVQVSVVKGGQKVYQEAFGYADYENKVLLEENPIMEWGSVSKLFIWVSVMQLAEKGEIDLETDAREYLSADFLTESGLDKAEPFTVMELMNHTAGFEDVIVDLGFSDSDQVTTLRQALINADMSQVYTPGSVMAYSNYGASLAGYIVESVTGDDFYTYVQTHILDVLEMNDTTMNPYQNEQMEARKPYGYSYQGDGNFKKGTWTYVSLYPCGSVNGTMEDMVKFAQALLTEDGEVSPLFQYSDTLDQLFETTYAIAEGEAGIAHGFYEYENNQGVYFHYGNTICFSSLLALDINERSAVIIVSNQSNESDIVNGLMSALLNENIKRVATKPVVDDTNLTWSSTYIPARYVNTGYLRILRESAFLSLEDVNEEQIVISQLGKSIVFENNDGNYIYDNDELILGITDNTVTHFKLGDIEYVPAQTGRSAGFIIVSVLILVVCIVYFVISLIKNLKLCIKKYCLKKSCDIDSSRFVISITGSVIILNNICLILNSLPWPVSEKISKFIVMNIVFGIILLIELIYYTGRKIIRKKQFDIKNIMLVITGILFLGDMLYWNFFYYS